MAEYNYVCLDCEKAATDEKRSELTIEEMCAKVVFATSHTMEPTPEQLKEATECPRCNGHNTQKTPIGVHPGAVYVRGYGWMDRAGCHRDMDMCKLQTDDPYGEHRVPGEVEDIKTRLKKSGQHDPNPQYFIGEGTKKDE